ncbi:hypothetical protein LEP1GSC188_4828 [Leptospira weilii serovar Topaz str. LT2116]|uniref:Uncharacterized protein n=1 Tax=Leptospira weilii serovar Topaz str. LT2116 TaxID=1088540 RepID=M3FQ07_9LEPT|nr:hypothetical protein LEP1GSC188_4828 [Leptospira weilii serovar Topaz str. LT2116]
MIRKSHFLESFLYRFIFIRETDFIIPRFLYENDLSNFLFQFF